MKLNWCDVVAINRDLFVVLWMLTVISQCYGLDTGTVAPLNSDISASSERIIDNKDLKKLETRYNDPPPEYYK